MTLYKLWVIYGNVHGFIMTLQIITLDAGLIVHEVDVVMCSFVELIVSSMRKNITENSTHSGSPSH